MNKVNPLKQLIYSNANNKIINHKTFCCFFFFDSLVTKTLQLPPKSAFSLNFKNKNISGK